VACRRLDISPAFAFGRRLGDLRPCRRPFGGFWVRWRMTGVTIICGMHSPPTIPSPNRRDALEGHLRSPARHVSAGATLRIPSPGGTVERDHGFQSSLRDLNSATGSKSQ